MATWRRTGMVVAAAAALGLAACGSDPTREDAIAELVGAGFTAETSECIVSDLEAGGIEPKDLTGSISPRVESAIEVAVENCFTGADLGGLFESDDELRDMFIEGILETGLVDQAQAACIADYIESSGADWAGVIDDADFDAQVAEAVEACL